MVDPLTVLEWFGDAVGKQAIKTSVERLWKAMSSLGKSDASTTSLPPVPSSKQEYLEFLAVRAATARAGLRAIDPEATNPFNRMVRKHVLAVKRDQHVLAHELRDQISVFLERYNAASQIKGGSGTMGGRAMLLYDRPKNLE